MDTREKKREENGDERNIWNQKMGSVSKMVLSGIFGHKRKKECGGWC